MHNTNTIEQLIFLTLLGNSSTLFLLLALFDFTGFESVGLVSFGDTTANGFENGSLKVTAFSKLTMPFYK